MADEQKQQANTGTVYSRNRATMILWASIGAMALLIFSLPTVIVLAFGMLPSIAAYVIDQTRERYATFCVASINFCGVFPYLMDLWFGNHTLYEATNIMADVFALFIMFGAAAIGWAIFLGMPPIISSFLSVIAQQRVNTLRSQQKTLIEEWGEAVTRTGEAKAESKPSPASPPESAEPKANGRNNGRPDAGDQATPQAAA